MTLLDALSEGPARLGADDVAAAQRRRILAAMVAATAERGYANVSISDVVARARISRTTFYELFRSKEDCFLAAFEAAVADLLGAMASLSGTSARGVADGPGRVRALVAAYLTAVAAAPDIARVCLVEIYAAGAAGAVKRRDMQRAFVDLIKNEAGALAATGERVRDASDFEFEAIVGAISSIVTQRVATGEASTLPELADAITGFIIRSLQP